MNLKCIIFDLDGTLVDSESLCNKALLDLLPAIDESVEKLTIRYHEF
jgi:beta-phosphoglucomutase-like phosphatase (HAD superfamily)